MPAIRNRQHLLAANGINQNGDIRTKTTINDQELLATKKLKQINEEYGTTTNNKMNGKLTSEFHSNQQDEEIFLDTNSLGAHNNIKNKTKSQENDEPIVIFDGQSNSSIAQTARDQFAAALLRLQTGLDESTKRLSTIENKLEDVIRQRNSLGRSKSHSDNKSGGGFLGRGQLTSIIYLGWPVLVYFAMRAIERRSLAQKLA